MGDVAGEILTVQEAAVRLGLRPSTIRKWVLRRQIGIVRPGCRAVRVPASEVNRILRQGYRPPVSTLVEPVQ